MRNIIRQEHGSALLISLVVMLLISTVALMAVKKSTTDMTMSYNQIHEEQAFYLAEAGAKQAIAVLDTNHMWRVGYNHVSFGPGNYSVRVLDSNQVAGIYDTILVLSRGNASTCASLVEVAVERDYFYPWSYAMFADKGINFDASTCTDSWDSDSGSYANTQLDSLGNVGSNGTITSSQNVTFGGDISVATPGGINLGVNNIINGDTTSTADSVSLNQIPASEWSWAAANSNAPAGFLGAGYTYDSKKRSLNTGQDATVVLQSGVYFFSSITLGKNSAITLAPGALVSIYVTGDIYLQQGSKINEGGAPASFRIYSQGDLSFDQDNAFYAAFYGPNATIQYDQTTSVYGSLVASSIQLDQGACFHYDRALSRVKKYELKGVTPITWREIDDPGVYQALLGAFITT